MVNEIAKYQRRIDCTIDTLAEEVRAVACIVVQDPFVAFRTKDPETLSKKMRLKNTANIFSIDDVYAIRIVVASVDEVYDILGKIVGTFPGHLDHDYIREPKTNPEGKQLRLLQFIAYRNQAPFELQVTTQEFNEINELLHEHYHHKKYHLPSL